jgi:hypothetical protein
VSRLSRQCGIFNISQPYRPPRSVTGIALLLLLLFFEFFKEVINNNNNNNNKIIKPIKQYDLGGCGVGISNERDFLSTELRSSRMA